MGIISLRGLLSLCFVLFLGLMLLFVADPNLRSGGQIMITVDILGWLMYAQVLLFITLFFAVQIIAAVPDRVEQVGDWVVYRGTWYGLAIQCLSIAIVAGLVFFAETDHMRVTWTLVLIMANAVWFASLRGVFLFADYRHHKQTRRM